MRLDWISRCPAACRIAVLAILFAGESLATNSSVPDGSSAGNLAGYVAAGVGLTTEHRSLQPTPTQPSESSATSMPLESTGSGSAYASKCYSALSDWAKSSLSYGSSHQITTTYTSTTSYAEGLGSTISTDLRTVSASSVTTLCDGHPRAIGSAKHVKFSTSIYPTTMKVVDPVPGPFTTPPPCSIDPTDCAALWTSFKRRTSSELLTKNETLLEPPCATAANQTSYSFKEDACVVSIAQVFAQEARLYYWPVRTVNGTEHFCLADRDWRTYTPTTIAGTRTGEGPNVFMSGDITITSPMVAISLSSISRYDGCGPTLDHTILTVPPEQVNSVRGARAAYAPLPFNYADLNWMCPSSNGTYTVQDVQGENCYQNVPAAAYWGAYPSYDQFHAYPTEVESSLTIINDYHPYVAPPSELSSLLTSVWGTGAIWHIDGVWDPPIALSQAKVAAGATLPAGGSGAGPTTLASPSDASQTPAAPASSITVPSAPTAAPDVSSHAPPAQSDTLPQSSAADAPEPSSNFPNANPTEDPSSPPDVGSEPAHASDGGDQSATPGDSPPQGPGPQDGQDAAVYTVTLGKSSQALPVTPIGGTAYQVGSQTLQVGGAAQTIDSEVVAAASDGVVVGSDSAKTTIPIQNEQSDSEATGVIAVGSETFMRSQLPDHKGQVLVNAQTTISLEVGQSAATLGTEVLSAASAGLTTISADASSSLGAGASATPTGSGSDSDGSAGGATSSAMQPSTAGACIARKASKIFMGGVLACVIVCMM